MYSKATDMQKHVAELTHRYLKDLPIPDQAKGQVVEKFVSNAIVSCMKLLQNTPIYQVQNMIKQIYANEIPVETMKSYISYNDDIMIYHDSNFTPEEENVRKTLKKIQDQVQKDPNIKAQIDAKNKQNQNLGQNTPQNLDDESLARIVLILSLIHI